MVEVEEIKEEKKSNDYNAKAWSEEDEISLLSGYYEYQTQIKKRRQKNEVGGGFFEFIKPRLIRSSVKQSQVADKICRLKRKYVDRAASSNSADLRPHLQKLFQLSTKIWCDRNNNAAAAGVDFDLSGAFMCKEFLEFLYNQGLDVDLLHAERLADLKRKFGEMELSRSIFEDKQTNLNRKMEKLKYDHYTHALHKFFNT